MCFCANSGSENLTFHALSVHCGNELQKKMGAIQTFCFFFTLDAGLLARSQYPEGPATDHLDTGFSRFPCL